ncbi:MAG: hypothetical protein ING24_21210 [Roseomonas sp.]|nr:hypothetical protein [Roseomonas sp.]
MLFSHAHTKSVGAKSQISGASIRPDGPVLVGEVNLASQENYTNFAFHEFNLIASTWEPLTGTNANDFISKSGVTDDTLIGLAGHDTLLGFGGVDLLFGGDGNDLLDGGDLADWLYGDSGDDTLHGSDGHDVLYADNQAEGAGDTNNNRNFISGGTGDDILLGAWGKDSLEGNDGNDLLIGGVSGDFLKGGAGADIFLIDLSTSPQSVSNLLSADTIADFSFEDQDVLSFGLAGGVVNIASGPAPLVWSGVMVAPNGPELGLVLPDNGIGLGFVQAWLIAAAPSETSSGVWCAVDLDQDGFLGVEDILIRVQMPLLQATNLYNYAAPGSFGGLAGDARDDVLTALSEGSWVFGLGGADALLGQAATDRLLGGDGNDSLAGDAGDDLLWGGAGSDWVLGGSGHDALYAEGMALEDEDDSAALNRLEGEEGNDSLFGGRGLDLLLGGNDADFLYGGEGHDTLEGGSGNDTLIGSDGDNMLVGGGGTDSIDGGSGNDRIVWTDNLDSLDGGDGFDWLIVSTGLFVDLGLTEKQIVGGARTVGFEAVDGRSATASMTLLGSADGSYLFSGVQDDTLFGGTGDDILQSGAGSDTLNGGTGVNILEGGIGNDLYIGVGPDDLILENFAEGLDTIISAIDFYLPPEIETLVLAPSSEATRGFGGSGNNFLLGNANNNELVGGDGGDTISGYDGADTLDGGSGDDSLNGDGGTDLVSYVEMTSSVTVSIADGIAIGAGGNDTLIGFENVLGGVGADCLLGNTLANHLIGSDGDDTLEGAAGNDLLDGSSGNDWAFYAAATSGVTVDLVTGRTSGAHGADTLDGIGNVQGGLGADSLRGNANENILVGGDGNDVIDGGEGSDWASYVYLTAASQGVTVDLALGTSFGAAGNDTLAGIENVIAGAGDDSLLGDGNANLLTGGSGADTLSGGTGQDTLDGGAGDDRLELSQLDFLHADGGGGTDTLALTISGFVLNLANIGVSNLLGVEAIDLGAGGNTLRITALKVLSLSDTSNTLHVTGGAGASLEFDDAGWVQGTISGGFVTFTNGAATALVAEALVALAPSGPTNGDDNLTAAADNDSIDALSGNDSIFGDAGDDTLAGGAGADTMDGGAGDDLFFVLDAGDLIIETVGGGADTIITSVSMTMPDHVEALQIASDTSGITLTGGVGNDMLIGSGLSNIFIGGAGDDVILAGNVTLADIFVLFTTWDSSGRTA